MIAEFKDAVPNIQINNCSIEINALHHFIKDGQNGIENGTDKDYHLHIQNSTNKVIYLIKNDNCAMVNEKNGQCDLIVLNDFKVCFIEIKGTRDNKKTHRSKAYRQLENTYKFYSTLLKFEENAYLVAVVCFNYNRRIIRVSSSTKKKEFKLKYNIDLVESNYILFN